MVERVMASSVWRLTNSTARSSRLHRLAGQSCSSVLLVASVMTSSCSSGGKAPRSTGPRSILKTGETVLSVAVSPMGHRVAGTGHFVGHLHIGRLVGGCDPQDQTATEAQRLWRGMGPATRLQPLMRRGVQNNRRSKGVRHRGILAEE